MCPHGCNHKGTGVLKKGRGKGSNAWTDARRHIKFTCTRVVSNFLIFLKAKKKLNVLSEMNVIKGTLARDDPSLKVCTRDHFDWLEANKPDFWRTGLTDAARRRIRKRQAQKRVKVQDKEEKAKAKWLKSGGLIDEEGKRYRPCCTANCEGRLYPPTRMKKCAACKVTSHTKISTIFCND